MADQFHDDIPASGNNIYGASGDVTKISETLGYLKDVLQQLCTGYDDTDATSLAVDNIEDYPFTVGDITRDLQDDSPSGVASTSFSFDPDWVLRVRGNLIVSNAGTGLYVRFNSDTGTNYSYTAHGVDSGGGYTDFGNTGLTTIPLSYTTSGTNNIILLDYLFATNPANGADVAFVGKSTHLLSTPTIYYHLEIAGSWNGPSGDVSAFELYPAAGAITGKVIVDRIF